MNDANLLDLNYFREQVKRAVGETPQMAPPQPPAQIGETRIEEITLREYHYINGLGETVGLTVAEPPQRRWSQPVIAIHQTNDCGRKEVFGLDGDPELEYGVSLAKRGHRVFATDMFLTGDRSPDRHWDAGPLYEAYPNWSMLGKMLQDMEDLMDTMHHAFHEPEKTHAIGHSMGGIVAYFLAAVDNRISRAVCNAAYSQAVPGKDPWTAPHYTARFLNDQDRSFCLAKHIDLLISLAAIHCDLVLICYAQDQIIEAPIPTPQAINRMRTFSKRVKLDIQDGPHAFPQHVREASFAFLESGLYDLPSE